MSENIDMMDSTVQMISNISQIKIPIDDIPVVPTWLTPEQPMWRYKKCGEYIVVIELQKDSKTNETRPTVNVPKFAKFRTNKARIVDIHHMTTHERIKSVKSTVYKKKTTIYNTDEIIEICDYIDDINVICSSGIHYFKSYEPAYYCNKKDGFIKQWHKEGHLEKKMILCAPIKNNNEVIEGLCIEYYQDGSVRKISNYINGKLDGLCIKNIWSLYADKYQICKYVNGRQNGPSVEYIGDNKKDNIVNTIETIAHKKQYNYALKCENNFIYL